MSEEIMAEWMHDEIFRIRPGDLRGNMDVMLRAVKAFAKAGERALEFPEDMLRGGDCGSLTGHPAFVAAEKAAMAKFEKAVKRIKNAPKVSFAGKMRSEPIRKGDDPRNPFLGHAESVFLKQVVGLGQRLSAIGCRDVVLGLSGGLDSALALLVAVTAFDVLGLDRAGVHVYTMPGFGTTKRTRGNAHLLCEGLGLRLETIDIAKTCRSHFRDIAQDETKHDVTFENAQARMRTMILMDKANQFGGIVVGTGDMSEIALGWCTYNGDHMSMFGVNAGVPKTVVREVCRWWAEDNGGKAADALLDIIATPVSPELLPAKDGEIAQKTEDCVGPYELHDFFLWYFVAEDMGRKEILALARKAFRGVYSAAEIARWLDVFFRRFFSQAFKRNCAPDGVKVFPVYLAQGDWAVPSDVSAGWMEF